MGRLLSRLEVAEGLVLDKVGGEEVEGAVRQLVCISALEIA